jgi:Flp pilus assembly protein TadD
LLLAACASTAPPPPVPVTLFDDARFAPAAQPIAPDDVMRLSPQMQRYVDTDIRPAARRSDLRRALLDELYVHGKLQLDYEASITRNASQAFDGRSGNCLSLVLMTGAFAQALGLDVRYQQVSTDEIWSRAGNMYFMSGHVNLQLDRSALDRHDNVERFGRYTVDFMPPPERAALHTREISLQTILAMYMNNRAAEAMIAGQLDDAYWRVRDALKLDPAFVAAYNTLGVVYLRHGDFVQSERALRAALAFQPGNPRVMGNYVQALRALGRADEARDVETRMAALEPFPPFYFFNLGQAALHAGDMQAARDFFKKELARQPDYHEFHYALAIADFSLGQMDEARSELALALEDAVKRTDHDLYAAKLDRLKAYRPSARVPADPVAQ